MKVSRFRELVCDERRACIDCSKMTRPSCQHRRKSWSGVTAAVLHRLRRRAWTTSRSRIFGHRRRRRPGDALLSLGHGEELQHFLKLGSGPRRAPATPSSRPPPPSTQRALQIDATFRVGARLPDIAPSAAACCALWHAMQRAARRLEFGILAPLLLLMLLGTIEFGRAVSIDRHFSSAPRRSATSLRARSRMGTNEQRRDANLDSMMDAIQHLMKPYDGTKLKLGHRRRAGVDDQPERHAKSLGRYSRNGLSAPGQMCEIHVAQQHAGQGQ